MANTCAHCGWNYMRHGKKDQCPNQPKPKDGEKVRRFKRETRAT